MSTGHSHTRARPNLVNEPGIDPFAHWTQALARAIWATFAEAMSNRVELFQARRRILRRIEKRVERARETRRIGV